MNEHSTIPAPDIRRGDIYYINPNSRTVPNGTEEPTARPAIIVSNDSNNRYSNYIEVVYLTTRYKQPLPTHVEINSADKPSTALCENINTINVDRVGDYMTHLTDDEMNAVDEALAISIGIPTTKNVAGGGYHPTPRRRTARRHDRRHI